MLETSKTRFVLFRSKPVVAAVVCFCVVFTASCAAVQESGSDEIGSSPPAHATSTTPAPKPTKTTVAERELSPIAEESIDFLRSVGIELGDVVKVKGGSYPTYRVLEASRFAEHELSTMDGTYPEGWDSTDADAAAHFAGTFVLNYVMDNPVANDHDANKHLYGESIRKISHPKYLKDLESVALENKGGPTETNIFQRSDFVGDKSKGFKFVSDGLTPRISSLDEFALVRSQPWEGGIYFEYEGHYSVNIVDKKNNPYFMKIAARIGVTVVEHNGKLVLWGWDDDGASYTDPARITPVKS